MRKIYTADSYYVQTKDEIKKKIDELKKMLPTVIWILIIGEPMIMAISYDIYDDIDYWGRKPV